MTTFDTILSTISEIFQVHGTELAKLGSVVINRDLNGRVRLILEEKIQDNPAVNTIVQILADKLAPHSFPADRMVLFEPFLDEVTQNAVLFQLEGFDQVTVVDRLATESDWTTITKESTGAPRIVFFSIKGGVGRSTAMAVSAWSFAEEGKRVMVLDLDLESPGLSSSLLPEEKRPAYGVTDWLVEDLVDNTDEVFENMIGTSDLSHNGEILVVPAHGKEPGEYIAKLGRVWMPKISAEGSRESWPVRLNRLLNELEKRWKPDVILIDSRAGIDEVASACITSLGAKGIMLFSIDGNQTWSGYRILFRHWHKTGAVKEIRNRLQIVGSMIPDDENRPSYEIRLLEHSWSVFTDDLYDEIPPGQTSDEYFNFDQFDDTAPHYPWYIRWNRGFQALESMHSRLKGIDKNEVNALFGSLLKGLKTMIENEGASHV
ncbi:ParA family protein [Chlorobaculum sp. 24CR]|uniref:ParA family protein n=1 Tax=Chlorobaculum sp. 24CR TaxID=2508878 RepID=UPI00100A5C0C|nr:ParA family protein [Chlorobaculum sp. 24CR]RXK82732.1 ParA family protein [Chlorobaculum sp. 24CR]